MRVVLRNTKLGLYYAGPDHWVSNPAQVLDFQDADHAAKFARQAQHRDLQVFLHYEGGTKTHRAPAHHTAHRRS